MKPNLLSSFKIRSRVIKNRVVMPAMVTFNYDIKDGKINDSLIKHYVDRAKGGVGTIIVEASCVTKDINSRLTKGELGLFRDELIDGHKKMVDEVHKYDCTILAQLCHAGIKGISDDNVAPSDFKGKIINKTFKAKEMTRSQIVEIKDSFVKAAIRAKQGSYDGVEIHCAHSYLLCSFLSPITNKRKDEYGGSFDNRMKLPLDILKEIRKECGNDFIISIRMGYREPSLENGIKIAKVFEENGADILNISTGFGSSGYMSEENMEVSPDQFLFNIRVWGAYKIKSSINIPVISVGGIRNIKKAKEVIKNGCSDFVAVGRGYLCDPEFVNKGREGRKIIECFNCKKCMWSSGLHKCPGRKRYLESIKTN